MNSLRKSFIASVSVLLITLLLCLIASAQTASTQPTSPAAAPNPSNTAAQFDNRIFAETDKLWHVSRVKVGDTVTAHLTTPAKLRNGTELPKGTKLVGTVTEIKVKADKESPSKLGLLFTKVVPKNGSEIPVQLALVTVAPHLQQNSVDSLTAGNPLSRADRLHAGNGAAELNNKTTEGEALSRGLGARAPAEHANVDPNNLQPGKSYLPNVVLASYSMDNPGTILESKSGSVYVDSGVRLLLLQP